jgi:site-specific DNA-cytosine methylase
MYENVPLAPYALQKNFPRTFIYDRAPDSLALPPVDIVTVTAPIDHLRKQTLAKKRYMGGTSPWFRLIRYIHAHTPPWVIIESGAKFGRYGELVMQPLRDLGYHVRLTVLGACEVGAPTIRRRSYVIASLERSTELEVFITPGLRRHCEENVWPVGWDSGDPIVEFLPEMDPMGRLRLLLEESVPWMGTACAQSILTPFAPRAPAQPTVRPELRAYHSPSNVDRSVAFTSLPSEAARMAKRLHLGATMAHERKTYGILNPDFVEQLLGMPVGWSDAHGEVRRLAQEKHERRNAEARTD